MKTIDVIDSHTGGEPTRIVVAGGPDLGDGPLADRLERFRRDHDGFRSAVVNEPRGSDVLVGGLLCEPHDSSCAVGILYFNNVGFLGMCGHGTIGLVKTLEHMGRIQAGTIRIDTAVGPVEAELLDDGRVRVQNVTSYRTRGNVSVDVPGLGNVVGDIAWGGNWFFLVKQGPDITLDVSHQRELTDITLRIRQALEDQGITGESVVGDRVAGDGSGEIDHIELFGPPGDPAHHSRNFVLCPGAAYDRSPCGTGTSAKLACLAADGRLAPGEVWHQESVIGSVFSCSYRDAETQGHIHPSITGMAHVSAESKLLLDENDPFCWGIRA